jgi:hypothetical protein
VLSDSEASCNRLLLNKRGKFLFIQAFRHLIEAERQFPLHGRKIQKRLDRFVAQHALLTYDLGSTDDAVSFLIDAGNGTKPIQGLKVSAVAVSEENSAPPDAYDYSCPRPWCIFLTMRRSGNIDKVGGLSLDVKLQLDIGGLCSGKPTHWVHTEVKSLLPINHALTDWDSGLSPGMRSSSDRKLVRFHIDRPMGSRRSARYVRVGWLGSLFHEWRERTRFGGIQAHHEIDASGGVKRKIVSSTCIFGSGVFSCCSVRPVEAESDEDAIRIE